MRKILFAALCLCFVFSSSSARDGYPVSFELFREADAAWADIIQFSQGLSAVARDSLFEEQKEKVLLLQKDISSISFSLLTLITMIEIEFIHARDGQISGEAADYIEKYTGAFYNITDAVYARQAEEASATEDVILSKLYTKAMTCLKEVKRVTEQAGSELAAYGRSGGLEQIPAAANGEQDSQVIDNQEHKDIITGQSTTVTRYNPSSGYISCYTRDGRFVGRKKKE